MEDFGRRRKGREKELARLNKRITRRGRVCLEVYRKNNRRREGRKMEDEEKEAEWLWERKMNKNMRDRVDEGKARWGIEQKDIKEELKRKTKKGVRKDR